MRLNNVVRRVERAAFEAARNDFSFTRGEIGPRGDAGLVLTRKQPPLTVKKISVRLKSLLYPGSLICRFGGDEFVVLVLAV